MPAAPSRRPSSSKGAHLTIGKVIARLRPDFADLTVSKVRFLEAEGLLTPQRTGSGYRKYSEEDVERLRFILTAQRDHFWPLRVIRDALDAMDRGAGAIVPAVPPRRLRLTAEELAAQGGAEAGLVESLVAVGVLSADPAGRFGPEDLQIVESVVWLQDYGLEPRHLRPFKTTADREVGLVEQMLAPSSRGRDRQARATQIARHLNLIHGALVTKGLGGGVVVGRAGSTVEG
jgi:DNA-binding transcriptional MerR regulator